MKFIIHGDLRAFNTDHIEMMWVTHQEGNHWKLHLKIRDEIELVHLKHVESEDQAKIFFQEMIEAINDE